MTWQWKSRKLLVSLPLSGDFFVAKYVQSLVETKKIYEAWAAKTKYNSERAFLAL